MTRDSITRSIRGMYSDSLAQLSLELLADGSPRWRVLCENGVTSLVDFAAWQYDLDAPEMEPLADYLAHARDAVAA